MRILITGAMGHVGYATVRHALERGHEVIAQYRNTFTEADAKALRGDITWVRCDLSDPGQLSGLLERERLDGCIHTAATPNDEVARQDPLGSIEGNDMAVSRMLDVARNQGWKRFIYVSTGSVFQNIADVTKPIYEDATPGVTNVYSTTKYIGELLTAMYRTQFGVSASVVRISWVYGPPLVPRMRQNPRGPIPIFLKLALAGKEIHETGGADFGAAYTYVEDVAGGLLAAFESDKLSRPIYHLSCGRNVMTPEVAAAVRKAVPGCAIELGPGMAPWTDHTRMRGPLAGSRLQEDTGFTPRYSIEEGIATFADWMRAHPDVYSS